MGDASLKERKGDPVKAELDIAMKRIGELIMQVELLEAKTETSGPLGRQVAAMVPPPLPARVWPTASSGSVRPGVLPVPRSTP